MKEKQDSVLVTRIPKKIKLNIIKSAKELNKNISEVVRDVLRQRFDD